MTPIKVFTRNLQFENWERYKNYAKRVKSLRISAEDQICKTVFMELGCFRTTYELLPNLVKLNLDLWSSSKANINAMVGLILPRYSLIFLHSGIRELSLGIPLWDGKRHPFINDIMISLHNLVLELNGRATSVTSLQLVFWHRSHVVWESSKPLITGFQHLRNLAIPAHALTPKVIASLSQVQNLRRITVAQCETPTGSFADLDTIYSLPEGTTFRNLNVLEIFGIANRILSLFQTDMFPELTGLCIHKVGGFTAHYTGMILSSVADLCRKLQALRLLGVRSDNPGIQYAEYPHSIDTVNSESLRPLMRLQFLQSIIIECNDPVQIHDDELAEWILQCPSLSTFHLTQEPRIGELPTLTLDILHNLAIKDSKIVDLGLSVDTSRGHYLRLPATRRRGLKHLKYLKLGLSPVTSVTTISMYLAQFLPFELDTIPLRSQHDNDDITRQVQEWEQVRICIQCIANVKMEERIRSDTLERRVHMLQEENGGLRKKLLELGYQPNGKSEKPTIDIHV